MISLCYGSACVVPAGDQPDVFSRVSAPLTALPFWTADSLGLSSLQHMLQGHKTMRQSSASKLSDNLAFFSSPSTTPNLSSAQTAERDFFISVALDRESSTAGATQRGNE